MSRFTNCNTDTIQFWTDEIDGVHVMVDNQGQGPEDPNDLSTIYSFRLDGLLAEFYQDDEADQGINLKRLNPKEKPFQVNLSVGQIMDLKDWCDSILSEEGFNRDEL